MILLMREMINVEVNERKAVELRQVPKLVVETISSFFSG